MRAPPPVENPRERLLAAAVAFITERGLGELSLRELAAAIGTSHRMILYHFGSREGLLAEVVAEVEAGQRAILEALARSDAPPRESLWAFWLGLADASTHPAVRLFFELSARALRGEPGTERLRETLVEPWIQAVSASGIRAGLPPELARAQARLGMAVTRGLLLDLLATGDRPGVDAAMALFLDTFVPATELSPAPPRSNS